MKFYPHRSSKTPTKTTGTVLYTAQDAIGFCEPLSRYGELPSGILGAFYNTNNGLPQKSRYYLDRLGDLFHESEGLPAHRQIVRRPGYQWRHGINHETFYRKALGTNRLLYQHGVYDEQSFGWANTTQIVQLSRDDGSTAPSDHDTALSIAAASIELSARQTRGIDFRSHVDILKTASYEAQSASSPLSIPIPELKHTFSGAAGTVRLPDIHVKPDFLFQLEYGKPTGDISFVMEYDRSTEDVLPTKNLRRQSWLRKILCYSALSVGDRPIYETYLGVNNLLILCLFEDMRRMRHAMELVKQFAAYPNQWLFQTLPPIDPLRDASLKPQLFFEDWQRVSTPFNLSNPERR